MGLRVVRVYSACSVFFLPRVNFCETVEQTATWVPHLESHDNMFSHIPTSILQTPKTEKKNSVVSSIFVDIVHYKDSWIEKFVDNGIALGNCSPTFLISSKIYFRGLVQERN